MAAIVLGAALRAEYQRLFDSCVVAERKRAAADALVDGLIAHRPRYAQVAATAGIPWHVIAVLHNMECAQNFACHLHNGDPLSARTRQVPRGRPATGCAPFRWEASAADALAWRGLGPGLDWTLAGTLYEVEAYNGWGYRLHHPATLSPYLWSFSNHYRAGKYVSDGSWSASAVSAQCGAAVLLQRMHARGVVTFAVEAVALAD